MTETYKRIDKNTLEVINTPAIVKSTINKAEIQTKISHLELDKQRIQLEIDGLNAQIAILGA